VMDRLAVPGREQNLVSERVCARASGRDKRK
jgi:hypothetical protein